MKQRSVNLDSSVIKLVSFDVFDTVIARRCGAPETIFRIVGGKLCEQGLLTITPRAFERTRSEAERRARQHRGGGEITLSDIYAELNRLWFLPESKLEEVRSMANRYRSHWELSRTVRTIGKGLAEERLYELGERFVKWNLLRIKEDVRYLTVHEVRQIVSGGCATNTCNNYALRARVRRTEIDEHSVGELPPFIKGEVAPLLPWKKE